MMISAAGTDAKLVSCPDTCREEELRILRGEQDMGSSRINSGGRGTSGAAAGGGSDSGSSSDAEGDNSGGGWNRWSRAVGRPGQWGGMQQQPQQQAGGAKVRGTHVSGCAVPRGGVFVVNDKKWVGVSRARHGTAEA